ncbi:MAG: AAA family ATPase [Roseovarius sp.]|nr:AAA family ATPase [Roseovarius sp.]
METGKVRKSGQIVSLHIKGFRSLADVEIKALPHAAVLIGANGSGKSNFIRFFEMVRWMIGRQLANFVQRHGGADDQLFGGSKVSPTMEARLTMQTDKGLNDYRFGFAYAQPDRFIFTEESFRFSDKGYNEKASWECLGSGHSEAKIANFSERDAVNPNKAGALVKLLRQCAIYQFHDTSHDSQLKKNWDVNDNAYLRSHGGNLAAILLRLEREDTQRYELICSHIGSVLPIFERFELRESYGKVMLRWKARGFDKTIGAHLASDGSLRVFALVTLLNLPSEMLSDVILLDEPELGLHPAAVALVGDMIKVCATERQVMVATQSPLLVDAFNINEIIVLEANKGRSNVRRFEDESHKEWLREYTTGELWQKNVLGGRP